MSKKARRAQVTAILTAISLLVSMLALFTMNGSVAWYARITEAGADGMGVLLNDEHDFIERVEYFKVKSVTYEGVNANTYVFENTPSAEAVTALGQYVPIDPNRQVLMKLTLKADANLPIGGIGIEARSELAAFPSAVTATGNSLSSIVQFCVVAANETYTKADSTTANKVSVTSSEISIYADSLDTKNRPFSSVTYDDASRAYQTAFSSSVSLTDTNITFGAGETREIYVIIDYYDAAAEYLSELAQTQSTPVTGDENNLIYFDYDFSLLIG